MSVYDNLAFGLKLRRTPKKEIDRRVHDAAELLGLADLLNRKPKQLSGGQRQRVALGRAIVREPKVFLMDEPLSNLDAKLRVQMRAELIRLHQRLQTTMIYVTHDQVEAMTMGTRIAVLRDGVLQQIDAPQVLYDHPVNMFVAGFIGSPSMNFVDAKLEGTPDEMWVNAGSFRVPVPANYAPKLANILGKDCFFGIRPEDMYEPKYAPPEVTQDARMRARVDVTEPLGAEIYLYLLAGEKQLIARVDPRTRADVGDEVEMVLDMGKMHIFDRSTQEAYV
jgi:multiple sugar transport system ATP-binding protein